MSPAHQPPVAPAAPAGHRTRPERGRYRWIALLLVLAALLGTGAAAPSVAETRATAAAPASDPGGETHDQAATGTALPGRARQDGARLRPAGPGARPQGPGTQPGTPAPVPAPRDDALRCVVMRC
ncbi:hypothetical protein [Streptomyces sp. NPDC004284]|uniref:hypothetical protein n=1 Tax=Streptomyces sp. NPDC004284 TaxID=3364695 RepID=UPI0036A578B3